jgi:hypothetical protein
VTVDVPDSGTVLISVTSAMSGDSNATSCEMSYTVSDPNSLPATANNAVILAGPDLQRASATSLLTGLKPGNTTFTAQYRAQFPPGNLECFFSDRTIVVLPIP